MSDQPYIRWWDPGATEEISGMPRWEHILNYVRGLEQEQADVHERMLQNHWLYHQKGLMGIDGEVEESILGSEASICTTNVCESVVDTSWAMIAKHQPRVVILTDDADFSDQQKAKMLEKYIEAEYHRMGVYTDTKMCFRAAEVFGTSAIYIYEDMDANVPCVEHVLMDELRWDDKECRAGNPRQIHRVMFVDRDVVLEWDFVEKDGLGGPSAEKKQEAVISASTSGSQRRWTDFRTCELGMVPVVESWRINSGKRRKGRHCISVEGACLIDEEWDSDELPFVFLHWVPPVTGFLGRGLVEQSAGNQLRINKLNWTIQRAQDLFARPRYFFPQADKHLQNMMNNSLDDCAYLTNTGREYKPVMGQALGQEIYNERTTRIQEAREMAGVTLAAASGEKPKGVESAVAIREAAERETGRFALQAQWYEDMHLEIARKVIKLQREIVLRTGKQPTAKWDSGNVLKLIPWEKVDLDEDRYTMKIEAASLLPRTPAGRAQFTIELAQANMITQQQGLKLLKIPDLEREINLNLATTEAADKAMELLEEEDGEKAQEQFPMPESYMDLELAKSRVQARYNSLMYMKRVPPQVLENYRYWIKAAQDMIDRAKAGAQALTDAVQAQMPQDPMAGGLPVDPRTVTPMNPVGGTPDSANNLSPKAMGLTVQ